MRHFFTKRVPPARLILAMIVITLVSVTLTVICQNHSNQLKDDISTARLEKSSLQREGASLQQEISISGTDAYIEAKARDTQGYLMPGEIQFVIMNPEALYGAGSDIQIEVAGN